MDFYAPDVKWIKSQKKLEKKLFNELVTNAIKEYGSWEYKLNYVENLLKYKHINEWVYTEKMNALKRKFDSSSNDDDIDDDDVVELELIAETDTHTLFREDEPPQTGFLSNGQPSNRYYVYTNERAAALEERVLHTDSVFHIRDDCHAETWFRGRYGVRD